MAGYTGTLTAQVIAMLADTTSGVNARLAWMEANDPTLQNIVGIQTITAQNVSVEIVESSGHAQYPALFVYCEKAQNLLLEKFREFSGWVHVVIEVRHTQDKLAQIEQQTELYMDAVSALLGESRGDWGDGASYSGGYQVNYEPVVKGGKNFLQRAKIHFAMELSE